MYGYEIFHEDLMKTLISSAKNKTAANAYIFEGENGLGKLECAKLFAAALTCDNEKIAPCGACPSCIETKAGTNPDIIFIHKRDDRQTIGVDKIREINESVIVKPFSSPHKVYIIPDGDLLTPMAQNAFLKTLEEPPEYAVFIIITTNRNIMLETVLSRSVLIHFPPVSDEIVKKYADKKYPECENRDFVIKYCEGIPKKADEIVNNEEFYSLRSSALDKLPYLMTKNKLMAFEIKKYLDDNKENADQIFDFWISYLRDILITEFGSKDKIINKDKLPKIAEFAEKFNPKLTTKGIDVLFKAKEMLRRNVSVKSVSLYAALNI